MYISLAESCAKGIERWSEAHQPSGNDNEGDVARLDALTCADLGVEPAARTPAETPHARWLVPGMGNTF
jgi:hypothetical protein